MPEQNCCSDMERERVMDGEADHSVLCLLYFPLHEALSTVNFKGDVGRKETGNVLTGLSRVVGVKVPDDKRRREMAQ